MDEVSAVEFVKRFLRYMEDRDLKSANEMMAPEAEITFPGNRKFKSQAEMVQASRGRYQWVKKNFEQVDVYPKNSTFVVYIIGTLYGVNRHGVSFSGVRYLDRFEIIDGLIARQDVWNDLAESGVLEKKD